MNDPTQLPPLPEILRRELDLHSWNAVRGYFRTRLGDLADIVSMLQARSIDVDAVAGVAGIGEAFSKIVGQFVDTTTLMDGNARLDDLP